MEESRYLEHGPKKSEFLPSEISQWFRKCYIAVHCSLCHDFVQSKSGHIAPYHCVHCGCLAYPVADHLTPPEVVSEL